MNILAGQKLNSDLNQEIKSTRVLNLLILYSTPALSQSVLICLRNRYVIRNIKAAQELY